MKFYMPGECTRCGKVFPDVARPKPGELAGYYMLEVLCDVCKAKEAQEKIDHPEGVVRWDVQKRGDA